MSYYLHTTKAHTSIERITVLRTNFNCKLKINKQPYNLN